LIVPNAAWEPFLFKTIDERTAESGLPRLRTIRLTDDDFELRIWVGFGQNGEDGLVLRRSAGQWSALHLHGMFETYPPSKYQQALSTPKSGWETMWRKLTDAKILSLSDASTVAGCDTFINDGTSYVVEFSAREAYRTYRYANPIYAKCDEAKQVINIGQIITEEFGLGEFSVME
jgi:hypothetical protein